MAELDLFERRLHAALVRRVGGGPIEFDAAAFAHEVAVKEPRRHGLGTTLRWVSPVRTLAWLALLALLLIALGAGLLVVGALRQTPYPALHDVALVPTGIDVLTQDTGAYGRAVVDGGGKIWALGDGRLVRFDPASGSARTWTVSDDAAFEMDVIAPAGAGGVWLAQGRMLRWFDGTTFRTLVEAPADIAVAAEAPDGSVWAATTDGVVHHWTGSSWTSVGPGRPNADASISAITLDAEGRPWIGWLQYPWPPGAGWVSRYDGSGWTTFDGTDASPLATPVWSIAALPDGTVWVATDGGLARFDGSSWTEVSGPTSGGRSLVAVATGPDGAVWVAEGPVNAETNWISVARFDGRSWVTYDQSDGLPADALYRIASMIPTEGGVYVGTGDGIYRLANDRWERAWPPGASPMDLTTLLAVSRDELWARGSGIHPTDDGLWQFRSGRWTREPIDPDHPHSSVPAAMALGPDGTVWAAGEGGVAYWSDGHWSVLDPTAASAIAIDKGGAAWVVGMDRSGVWALEPDGTAWARRAIASPPRLGGLGAASLAVDGRGELWLGEPAVWGPGGLARFDGDGWETLDELGGSPIGGATVLGTDPEGAVWIAVTRPVDASQTEPTPVLTVRIDGEEQTVVEMPAGNFGMGARLAPDGTLWVATDHGPARYDGQRWTYPYERICPSWMGVDRVATDGTVYGSIGGALLRLPALMH